MFGAASPLEWPIVRQWVGLAASPPVRYSLKVAGQSDRAAFLPEAVAAPDDTFSQTHATG